MSETREAPHTSNDAAPSDEKPTTSDGRSSLERLAAFTRQILRVPKEAIHEAESSR